MTRVPEKPLVLVIDDETGSRESMAIALEKAGLAVRTFDDARKALLEFLDENDARLAVCDLRMPGMDGYAFHDQLRAERPGLAARTVFVTGDVVSSETRDTVLRQPVLAKPFSFDQIEEAVIALMRGAPYRPPERAASVPR